MLISTLLNSSLRSPVSSSAKINVVSALQASTTLSCKPSSSALFFPGNSDNDNSLGNCGHTFCASCIRDYFRERLQQNIVNFQDGHFLAGELSLPTTPGALRSLSATIRSLGGNTSRIFSYRCPECRATVRKAPAVCYKLRSLLLEAGATLSGRNNNSPTDELHVNLFNTLFEY